MWISQKNQQRRDMSKKKKLKDRFLASGRSVTNYARAYGFDKGALYRLLDGELTGKNFSAKGRIREMIVQLHADGIWTEPLPWEKVT